jgi:hypothetical protein
VYETSEVSNECVCVCVCVLAHEPDMMHHVLFVIYLCMCTCMVAIRPAEEAL